MVLLLTERLAGSSLGVAGAQRRNEARDVQAEFQLSLPCQRAVQPQRGH